MSDPDDDNREIPVTYPDPTVAAAVRAAQERALRGQVVRRERRPRRC
jgi:hypothetical protein